MKDRHTEGYKMSWYNFVVDIGIFLSMLVPLSFIGQFLSAMTATIIALNFNLGYSLVYIIIDLILIAPWAWLIWVHLITRKNLKNFKVEAPGDVYLLHVAPWVIYAIESNLGLIVEFSWNKLILLLIVLLVWVVILSISLWLNYKYFENRVKLFCNE